LKIFGQWRLLTKFSSEQIWHKQQKIKELKDGSIILNVPVAHFTETKREILKYGAEVEVLKPLRLKKEIIEEIKKMKEIYQWDTIWVSRYVTFSPNSVSVCD
jgi:predicted DNA-binding transcriptional regulator YafY